LLREPRYECGTCEFSFIVRDRDYEEERDPPSLKLRRGEEKIIYGYFQRIDLEKSAVESKNKNILQR
jgi:hypothetical protein